MHVLLLESDAADADERRLSLRQSKHPELQISIAYSVEDTCRTTVQPFDVVLLDLTGTAHHSLDLLRRVRSQVCELPIVVLTCSEDEDLIAEALANGADDYVTLQEFRPEVVVRSLRYVIERHRRHRAEMRLVEERTLERKRLSRELHDGVLQSLYAIRVRLQMLASRVRVFDRESSERISQISDTALDTINETRRITRDLRSSTLETRRLAETLREDAAQLEEQFAVRVQVRSNCTRKLNCREKHHLYRIFQESVHNAIRHGQAGGIVVELADTPAGVTLQVQDDGSGFDVPAAACAGKGLGLSSIRERAEILGGQAKIESKKNCGTLVSVELPAATASPVANATLEAGDIKPAPPMSDTVEFTARDTLQ